MNETFLALSMYLCIGLFWAILFLFRALESRIRQELTGLRGKIGETDSRLFKNIPPDSGGKDKQPYRRREIRGSTEPDAPSQKRT